VPAASCLFHVPTDDFIEPEEYAEPEGEKPGEAANLGRSELAAGQGILRELELWKGRMCVIPQLSNS
jgi:hypothetical protein